ncbi:TadE/TadG family type IV pilus assembly protein [Photobacterium sp. MCCC 1A19761]|uniref:TadE/TadG family type IV pilus assembly protein n=1 Tax=Photobacterium sp. MCCC 1A19761 TaxID=3115000 RepID=UPI00307CF21C
MKRSEHGLAMVEFTILLPLLLLILMSILELGRAFYTYTELEKLTRDCTRYLLNEISKDTTTTYALTQDQIDAASNLAVYGSVNGGSNAALPALNTDQISITQKSNHIQVEITYPYQPVLASIPSFFSTDAISLNFNMTSSYTMRTL